MNKRGIEKIMSIVWFGTLVLVSVGIVYVTLIYYGAPYNVQGIESTSLANQIESCMTNQGYLNDSVLTESFRKNFLSDCHINPNVENAYNWTNLSEYYMEVHVYKFDNSSPGLLGDELTSIYYGNVNLKNVWAATQKKAVPSGRTVNTIVIHATEGSTVEGAVQTISERGLSIHYMIDRNGNIISQSNENQYAPSQYQDAFVSESSQAEHAGCGVGSQRIQSCPASCIQSNGLLGTLKSQCQQLGGDLPRSQWCCIPDYNVHSIGIELVNLGNITGLCKTTSYKSSPICLTAVSAYGDLWENYTSAQINSLVNLVSDIAARYNIPLDRNHIVGHYQITTNKTDPEPSFNWTSFMEQLNARGAVAISSSPNSNQVQKSFYVTDKSGKQYVVTVLALIGKDEKNVA